KQLASEVYAYSYTPKDPGLLVVGATLPSGDPDKAYRAMLREIFRMVHEDVSDEELAKARTIIESDAVYQKETGQGMARKLGFYETVAGSLEWEQAYGKQVAALTPRQLRETFARYVTTQNMSVTVLLPDAETKALPAADLKSAMLSAAKEE